VSAVKAAGAALAADAGRDRSWVNLSCFDRRLELTAAELQALRTLGDNLRRRRQFQAAMPQWQVIERLLGPLDAVRAVLRSPDTTEHRRNSLDAIGLILMRCAAVGSTYWSWSDDEWMELIGQTAKEFKEQSGWQLGAARSYLVAYAYVLGEFTAFSRLGGISLRVLTRRVFGAATEESHHRVYDVLGAWGYRVGGHYQAPKVSAALCRVLLHSRSPRLEDLSTEVFDYLRQPGILESGHRNGLHAVQRAVASMGLCQEHDLNFGTATPITGTAAQWVDWIDRWSATSTLSPDIRKAYRRILGKVGRWLAAEHPDVVEPSQWTRQLCADWVAAVGKLNVGDYAQSIKTITAHVGDPLAANSKARILGATRVFLHDCQQWEWITPRFDPARALATPRSIRDTSSPNPRVIADDVWAKLLWAGLNLQPDDLPVGAGHSYPVEFIRAVTVTWLFSGQRSDEIARLRVGCIRWQHDGVPTTDNAHDVLAREAVCLLDIPTHKTGHPFTKPVDPLLGKAIEAWQAIRPTQPKFTDRKTGEQIDLLFALRGYGVAKKYINKTVIPALCRKAGVPPCDVRGTITSHRARSTIATQLYNAKEPMTLFELQAWLGHRSPMSTQYYAKITPNTLSKAYSDAGYFARNLRTIEILVDRDAVTSGQAAAGQPWQYYDLGHGYCTYTFFEQCPHRMACARCDFYTPKGSTKAQLLEAKTNLQRMLVSIPLTDDERAAVDDGQTALDALLDRLTDVPTPAGPTPRDIGVPPSATLLPIVAVNQFRKSP
jgi:integrase